MVVAPGEPHYVGDGFRVVTFIPSSQRLSMERMSPFIMLDYNPRHYFPPTSTQEVWESILIEALKL
jgi:quercetin 2,3-dioxygenase